MLERNFEPTLNGRRLRLRLPFQQRSGLIENPRLPERAARDHDCIASRLAIKPNRVFGGLDVAVSDYRNLQRLSNGRDFFPPRRAGVHLGPGAWMQRERASS